eukprot:CAMPEP_0197459156 /NCGR_PEP_ID=MMETSP1175-20131217/50601_1 /TAXON_ID=1003142 /ORGANISM="Triceratium dubium, Strain CCMP147" /LENGTH=447 /DNA_ID=CAMNT_0042993945 /DNA_START=58 /DNA_END=1401 /DNA_ORIENTATION=+
MTRIAFFWFLLCALARKVLSVDYGDGDDVQTFSNKSEFREKVLESDSIALIQFYAPWCGHCKNFAPVYKEVAKLLKGIVLVGAVDAASDGPQKLIASQYGISGFPTIKVFGDDKKKPTTYKGGRDIQSVVQGTMNIVAETIQTRGRESVGGAQGSQPPPSGSTGLDDSKVVMLNAGNFKEKVLDNSHVGLVAFIAPWCGHCKALLPEWAAASVKLDGEGVYLGVVDATVEENLASQYGVQGFPTIKVFPGGANKSSSDAEDYSGGRTTEEIIQYALAEVDRTGVPKEIPELTGPDVLKESCDGTNRLCVLVALPHILDSGAEGRNKYRDMIANVAKTFRGTSFNFIWFEGSSQLDLEEKLELTFGYPAVAALSMDKGVYAVQRGSFTEKNIGKFLSGITTGRQPTAKVAKMPTIVSLDPWDGKDGTPIEEEPLDDIMGWGEDESGEL